MTVPSLPPAVELSRLRPGQRARLHAWGLEGTDRALLESLGLTHDCMLRVCQAGDPCIVVVRDTRIGLAASVARTLLVVPDERAR